MNCRTVTVMSGDQPKPPAPWTVGIAEYRSRTKRMPHPAPNAFELVVWHETDLHTDKPLAILDMDDTIALCQERFDMVEQDILDVIEQVGLPSGREYLGKVPEPNTPRYAVYSDTFLAYRNRHDAMLFKTMGYAPDRIHASALAALDEFLDDRDLDAANFFDDRGQPLYEQIRQRVIQCALNIEATTFPWYPQSAATLQQLAERFNLVLVTRGETSFQHHKLTQNQDDVARYFARVYVTPDKDRDVFAAVFADCGVEPGPQHVAIGNTYKTDIEPLVEHFGCGGVWLDQNTQWVMETEAGHRAPTAHDHPAVLIATSLDDFVPHATSLSTIGTTSAQQLNLGLDRLFGPNSQQAEQEPAMFRAPDLGL